MAIDSSVLSAIGGGGLTESDYAGMTPEQISAVAGQGQKDRQIMLGTVMELSQQKLAERKQDTDEMHQDRMFKLMQNQDARAEFESINKAKMDQAQLALQQQRLKLEAAQTSASVANSSMQTELHKYQLGKLKQQDTTLSKMRTSMMEVPGYTDDAGKPLKMSVADLHSMGALDNVIAANMRKMVDTKTGQSKQIQFHEFLASEAKKMGISEVLEQRIRVLGPEAFKGMTKAKLLESHKNDILFQQKDAAAKEAFIQSEFDLIDQLRVDAASSIASGAFNATGGDVPGGKVPVPSTAEQINALLNGTDN